MTDSVATIVALDQWQKSARRMASAVLVSHAHLRSLGKHEAGTCDTCQEAGEIIHGATTTEDSAKPDPSACG